MPFVKADRVSVHKTHENCAHAISAWMIKLDCAGGRPLSPHWPVSTAISSWLEVRLSRTRRVGLFKNPGALRFVIFAKGPAAKSGKILPSTMPGMALDTWRR